MSDRTPPILFHPDAGPQFRLTVLDAYLGLPPVIRERLRSYAGFPTVIRTLAHPHAVHRDDRQWSGLSVSPAFQRLRPAGMPLSSRAFTSLGSHQLFVAEHNPDGTPIPRRHLYVILAHEVGHRIDFAIGGDNANRADPPAPLGFLSPIFPPSSMRCSKTCRTPAGDRGSLCLPAFASTPIYYRNPMRPAN
jgi:hypothetical protein